MALRAVNSERAFTLIELVCVIALLGMLTALAMPVVKDLGHKRNLEIAARSVAMEMRKCQQKAIVSGHPQCIEFMLHNPYYDYRVTDCILSAKERFNLPEGIIINSTTLQPSSGGSPYVRYLPNGTSGSGGTLIMRNLADDLIYVIVTPVTGRVRISDQPPEHWN